MQQDIPVERIAQSNLLQCPPEMALREAALRMSERWCSSIVVMEGERPVGIWTERDALAVDFTDPGAVNAPISEHMSAPLHTLPADTPVGEAAAELGRLGVRHLLVVNEAGRPQGILSQSDIALNQGLEPYLRLREVGNQFRSKPVFLETDEPILSVSRKMRAAGADAAIVDDPELGPGIITERDVVRWIAAAPENAGAGDLASRPLVRVRTDDTLLQARNRLLQYRIRHLAVESPAGEIVGLLGFSDMMEGVERVYLEDLRRALEDRENALKKSRQSLRLAERLIEASLEGVMITDARGIVEFINPAFTHITGYQPEEIIGQSPGILNSGRQDDAFYRAMWQSLREKGYWQGEIWNRRKDGEIFLELLTITAITDDDGEVSHYAGLFTDITRMKEDEEYIRRLAYYDALTGLPNRRLLDDRMELAIAHSRRSGSQLGVLFFDLDHFKRINDTHGHELGDQLLLEVARRVRQCLREDDTLARLAGDEFVVLLPDIESEAPIRSVTRRIGEQFGDKVVVAGVPLRISVSIGVAICPADGADPESLLRAADAAMYAAKRAGRNAVRFSRDIE